MMAEKGHMSLLATPQYKESLEQIQTHRTRNTNYRSSVMQICLGRLLSFLLQIGLIKTFDALERDTCFLFDVTRVKIMVESFQWDEAAKYVPWFIPDPECSKEASILLNSMLHLKKKFKAYMIFEESRASSWKELMSKTVETLKELVPKTPELKDRLDRVQMPCSTSEFEDIIPLGLRAYRRHNNLSSVGNMPAPVIAHFNYFICAGCDTINEIIIQVFLESSAIRQKF